MKSTNYSPDRRKFIVQTATLTTGIFALSALPNLVSAAEGPEKSSVYMIGPMPGYTPQIGTLVSMLNYNRHTIESMVKGFSQKQLDHLHDSEANSIGSLILHLGATEVYYQANTFEGREDFNEEEEKNWGAAMNLGEKGRAEIKGHPVEDYLDRIRVVREKTLNTLKTKDDEWLMAIDPAWSQDEGENLNTYWKWFHVCEHEANHRGQIAFLRSRLPG